MKKEKQATLDRLVLRSIGELEEKDSYVIPILERVEDTTGRIIPIGDVYVTLERLTEKELVLSWLEKSQPDRERVKRYYTLTQAGKETLAEWESQQGED